MGMSVEEIYELTAIDPWFLDKFQELLETEKFLRKTALKALSREQLYAVKQQGFSDRQIAYATKNQRRRGARLSAKAWGLFRSTKRWIPAPPNLKR